MCTRWCTWGGADWEAKLKPYIFDRYPQAEAVWFMSYTDGSRWLNLDWTAFHPGGEFLYSDRDYGIVGVGDVELPGGGRVAPGLPGGTALICSTLIVSPVSYWSVPASGGSLSVTVTAPAGCSWSVTNPFSSWVTVTPTSGTGTRTITVRVAPNTGAARYATITIAGKSFNVGQQVRSQSQGCISSITPQAYWSVPASGGSLSVTVTAPAGCSWSVTNFNSWITVTPTSGTGSQTITVRVAANFGAARYATITIGGKSFNVGQQRRV